MNKELLMDALFILIGMLPTVSFFLLRQEKKIKAVIDEIETRESTKTEAFLARESIKEEALDATRKQTIAMQEQTLQLTVLTETMKHFTTDQARQDERLTTHGLDIDNIKTDLVRIDGRINVLEK